MEYIKQFTNHSEYLVFTNTDKFVKPNVSYCITENENHYNPIPPDYSKEYLTFVAKTDGTFKFSGSTTANTLSYSLDNGSTWVVLADNTDSPTVTSGNKILWKGTCTPQSSKGIGRFYSTSQFDIEGNAMSLLYGDDFKGQTSLEGKVSVLSGLFSGNTNVVSAENLSLPATTVAQTCYQNMFYGCKNLTKAPSVLPATTLEASAYTYMFRECTNLTTTPELPATTLAQTCYRDMFYGCTSLTTAPELPATTLASDCYRNMFYGCKNLTKAPSVLPATTVAQTCYQNMFRDCTNLATAPELPATTLVYSCYSNMFQGCTNLNYIKAMFTTTPSSTYTSNWVSGVASSGTFVKNASATWDVTDNNGIPNGWTIQTASS